MNKKNSKVAVLLCTYNGTDYLYQFLQSLLNQASDNWILYISDDGSTDNTLA